MKRWKRGDDGNSDDDDDDNDNGDSKIDLKQWRRVMLQVHVALGHEELAWKQKLKDKPWPTSITEAFYDIVKQNTGEAMDRVIEKNGISCTASTKLEKMKCIYLWLQQ